MIRRLRQRLREVCVLSALRGNESPWWRGLMMRKARSPKPRARRRDPRSRIREGRPNWESSAPTFLPQSRSYFRASVRLWRMGPWPPGWEKRPVMSLGVSPERSGRPASTAGKRTAGNSESRRARSWLALMSMPQPLPPPVTSFPEIAPPPSPRQPGATDSVKWSSNPDSPPAEVGCLRGHAFGGSRPPWVKRQWGNGMR